MTNTHRHETLIKHSSGVSFTLSEKETYMAYINDVMRDFQEEYALRGKAPHDEVPLGGAEDEETTVPKVSRPQDPLGPLIAKWEPFNVAQETQEDANHDTFFERFANGTLLCLLLNHADPAILDLKAVLQSDQTFKMLENHKLALQSAKNLGLVVVNIDAQQLMDSKPMPILSLLAQIMRYDFTNCIRLNNTIQMILLKREDETVRQFLKLDPKELLFRWINFILEKDEAHAGKSAEHVSNINTDFRDSTVYIRLARYIAPNVISEEDLEEVLQQKNEEDPESPPLAERALVLTEKLDRLNLTRRVVLTPQDITSGKSHMNQALLGSIFNDYGVATLMDHFDLDPQTMLDLRCAILDIAVEDLEKQMPSIRSPEFSSFVAAAKSLSKATKSDESHQTGILSTLQNTQAMASGLKSKLEVQRQEHEENMKKALEEQRETIRAEYEEKLEAMQRALDEQREAHEKALEAMRVEYEQKFEEQAQAHQTELETLHQAHTEALDEQTRIAQEELEMTKSIHCNEVADLKNTIHDLTMQLETSRMELSTKDSSLQTMQKESQSKLEERLTLHDEIDRIKARYSQCRKDLMYVMGTINNTFQAEEKLATWRFGSLKLSDLQKKCTMSGYLKKRSNGVVKNWKNRFWVLVEGYIFYFDDNKENAKLKGILRLDECRVEGYDKNGGKQKIISDKPTEGFVIFTPTRKMKTQAPSAEEAEAWKKAIVQAGTMKI